LSLPAYPFTTRPQMDSNFLGNSRPQLPKQQHMIAATGFARNC